MLVIFAAVHTDLRHGTTRHDTTQKHHADAVATEGHSMWNLLDDDGAFPSDVSRPVDGVAAVLPLFGEDAETAMSWQERALCAQTDPEAFFPEKGGSTREAKKVCTGCDVRTECLEYALANDERFGIWGGLSERERRKLKRQVV
jgi:WhiB family redox-sensing transcriptional regulator